MARREAKEAEDERHKRATEVWEATFDKVEKTNAEQLQKLVDELEAYLLEFNANILTSLAESAKLAIPSASTDQEKIK